MEAQIESIFRNLAETISAELTAANKRTAEAEARFTTFAGALRELLGEALEPANDLGVSTPRVMAGPAPGLSTKTVAARVPDSVFFDALSSEWIGAGKLRDYLLAQGHKVSEGSVYNRMRKLCHERPDEIEAAMKPERWRLKGRILTVERAPVLDKKRLSRKRASDHLSSPPRETLLAANDAGVARHLPALHRGDCLEIMRTIDDGSVDLILADLPYNVSRLSIDPAIDLEAVWREYRRIIKPRGNILLFATQPFANKLINAAPDLFKYDLIWEKNRATGFQHSSRKPMKAHENILVFSKGTNVGAHHSKLSATYNPQGVEYVPAKLRPPRAAGFLNGLTVGHASEREYNAMRNCPRSVLRFPKDAPKKGETAHPFAKPVALLEYLVRTYSNPEDVVLDNTMGSGSTCVAAMRAGRRSIGIEMTEKYFRMAEKRVAAISHGTAIKATEMPGKISPDQSPPCIANDNSQKMTPAVASDRASIFQGDCLEIMRQLPSGSIELVFTSPPYNLGQSSGGGVRGAAKSGKWKGMALANGYASYDDAREPAEYVEWQREVLRECWRLLSDDGAIFYNHKPRVQNGLLQTPLDLNPDLPLRQIVIWDRKGGFNFNQSFYLPTHEWIAIFAKPNFRLRSKGASGVKDVWSIPHERDNDHPAPFPVELARRAIETTSANTILDPFMGSGSTGVAALECGRRFIGIEIDPGYCETARKRIGLEALSLAA